MNQGDSATVTRVFTSEEVVQYAALAQLQQIPDRVPEPLIAGLFSYLLGVETPGPGTNYLKQDLQFKRLPNISEPITATVEITRIRPEKKLVDLSTTASNETGELLCQGRALVYVADVTASGLSRETGA